MSAVIIVIIVFQRFCVLSVWVRFVPSWGTRAEFFNLFAEFRFLFFLKPFAQSEIRDKAVHSLFRLDWFYLKYRLRLQLTTAQR